MVKVPLTQGHEAIIDDADADFVLRFSWMATKSKPGFIYARRTSDRASMSRLLVDAPKGTHVDHINHNTLDNRRENLRVCTPQQNTWNSRTQKRAKSKFKGVIANRPGQWVATITANGEKHYLGSYQSEEEAAVMYNLAAIKFFGRHAYLNEIR